MSTAALDSDTIDLAEVAQNIKRGWRRVLVGTAIGVAIATVILAVVPARFSGESSLVVRASENSASSLASRLSGSLAGAAATLVPGGVASTSIETEIQILSSRALAAEAVDSLRLQVRMRGRERIAPWQVFRAASFPGSFKRRRFHAERVGTTNRFAIAGEGVAAEATPGVPVRLGTGQITLADSLPLSRFDFDVYDREEAVTRFGKRRGVSKAGGEVIAVSYSADDSLTAAAAPNLLIRRYLDRRRTTDRGTNQHRVEFLAAAVDSIEHSLTLAERALREQQERSGVVDPVVVGKLELERASDLRKESSTLDIERGAIDQLLAKLGTGELTSRQLAAFPTFLRSPGINELLGQLSTLETKRLQLLGTLTPEDPEVIALGEGIKNIEAQLPLFARAYAQSLNRQRTDLNRQLDTLRSAIERLPATSEEGLRRQREVLRLGQVYAAMSGQLVEAKLAAIGEGGDVHALDIAEPPRKVSFPAPLPTLTGGTAAGALLGVILAVLGGFYGRYSSDARSIERQIGVPVMSLEPGTPFLLANPAELRTLLLVPLDGTADTGGVAERLMRNVVSRGLRGTVVDLSRGDGAATMTNIERVGDDFDFVVVRLPELASDTTLAAMSPTRPVLFVATPGRVERRRVSNAVENLTRLAIPCAGVVLSRRHTSKQLTS